MVAGHERVVHEVQGASAGAAEGGQRGRQVRAGQSGKWGAPSRAAASPASAWRTHHHRLLGALHFFPLTCMQASVPLSISVIGAAVSNASR